VGQETSNQDKKWLLGNQRISDCNEVYVLELESLPSDLRIDELSHR